MRTNDLWRTAFLVSALLRIGSVHAQEDVEADVPTPSLEEPPAAAAPEPEVEVTEDASQTAAADVQVVESAATGWPSDAPVPAPSPWAIGCHRPDLCGVVSIGGEIALLRRGEISRGRTTAAGFEFEVLAGPARWPLQLGLGAGVLRLDGARDSLREGSWLDDALDPNSSLTAVRTLKVPHFELVARLQPFWWRVHPFVEGFFGVGLLRQSASVENADGEELDAAETGHGAGMYYGATLGMNVRIGAHFALTAAIKRVYVGPLRRIHSADGEGEWSVSQGNRTTLAMWSPALALTLML